jgi:hypothetical protein
MKHEVTKTLRAWGTLAAAVASFCGSPLLAATICSVESIQALAPAGTTIKSATPTPLPVPHCKIDGSIITENPGPNQVNFRLQLPDEGWVGRYYFIGMGGSAGYVPTDSQIPAGNPLNRGIAVAGTDTGRQGDMLDWGFLVDPAKAKDHIDRAAHVARAQMLFEDAKSGTVSGVLVPPSAGASRDFLLCPYPEVAMFNQALADKEGAVDEAANWSCQLPRKRKS